jgi:1-acyl-sn-glycerol-3-phosphate acyltransferase
MGRHFYSGSRQIWRFIDTCTQRKVILHEHRLPAEGGYLLAPTHLSHLEPFLLMPRLERQIHWMARSEFYGPRLFAWCMNQAGCIKVRRHGVAASAIRRAIEYVNEGRVVGIFPEGGVAIRDESAMRGGAFFRGVCMIAQLTGVPIVPVTVAGTHPLRNVGPWLPFRRGRLWYNFGEAIQPLESSGPTRAHRRADRRAVAEQLSAAYQAMYREMLEATSLTDDHDLD